MVGMDKCLSKEIRNFISLPGIFGDLLGKYFNKIIFREVLCNFSSFPDQSKALDLKQQQRTILSLLMNSMPSCNSSKYHKHILENMSIKNDKYKNK